MKKPHGNTGRRKLIKKSAYLHIRIDPSLKTMAALRAVSDGLTLSEYIAMLIRKDIIIGVRNDNNGSNEPTAQSTLRSGQAGAQGRL
jgi:hypothetical protein